MSLIPSGNNPDFVTKIPSLSDSADIQTALKAVLYGTDYTTNANASTGVLTATDGSEGLVGHLNALRTSLTNASVLKSAYTAKGDLLAASSASTPAVVAAGTNDYLLKADSTASSGIAWFDARTTFLPRVAGSSYPLSGDLYVSFTSPKVILNDTSSTGTTYVQFNDDNTTKWTAGKNASDSFVINKADGSATLTINSSGDTTLSGQLTTNTLSLSPVSDTGTAATHYFVETATDGLVRPKTLANVKSEVVTTAAVNSAAATTVGTISSGTWQGSVISATYIDSALARLSGGTFSGSVTFSSYATFNYPTNFNNYGLNANAGIATTSITASGGISASGYVIGALAVNNEHLMTLGQGLYIMALHNSVVWFGVGAHSSSRSLKDNISELSTSEKDAFSSITPKSFTFRPTGEYRLGFIAEEVEDAGIPVYEKPADIGDDGTVTKEATKGISPMDMVAVLWAKVQEQEDRIKALESA